MVSELGGIRTVALHFGVLRFGIVESAANGLGVRFGGVFGRHLDRSRERRLKTWLLDGRTIIGSNVKRTGGNAPGIEQGRDIYVDLDRRLHLHIKIDHVPYKKPRVPDFAKC